MVLLESLIRVNRVPQAHHRLRLRSPVDNLSLQVYRTRKYDSAGRPLCPSPSFSWSTRSRSSYVANRDELSWRRSARPRRVGNGGYDGEVPAPLSWASATTMGARERDLDLMRWGLVPFCAKDTKLVSREHQPPRPPGLKWYAPPLGAAHLIITSEESHLQ